MSATASAWVQRFAGLIKPGGTVLDLACGSGRHVLWLSEHGLTVTGVDRDAGALSAVEGPAELIVADIEGGAWPLTGRVFDAVVVTNYLWRPLWSAVLGALAEGGVLIYETFADGQQTVGKPSRPEFLLQPGELLTVCQGLRVVAFEDGFEPAPAPGRFVQRIAAVKPALASALQPRYRLQGGWSAGPPTALGPPSVSGPKADS